MQGCAGCDRSMVRLGEWLVQAQRCGKRCVVGHNYLSDLQLSLLVLSIASDVPGVIQGAGHHL